MHYFIFENKTCFGKIIGHKWVLEGGLPGSAKYPWSCSSLFTDPTPPYGSSSLGSSINENVLVIKRSYVVTETRVDNNLKQANPTAITNNHTTNMYTTNLSSATKHHKTRLPLGMHSSKQNMIDANKCSK